MQTRTALITSTALLAAVTCSTALSASWVQPRAPLATGESSICAQFSILSGDYTAAAGSTNGYYGTAQPGEQFTMTFSGTGTGSFRIVGNPAGTITLSGPGPAPGTLTYTEGSSPAPGAQGIGFYFDSGEGSLTLQASCRSPITHPAPALGARGLALLAGLLVLVGVSFARRVRRRRWQS